MASAAQWIEGARLRTLPAAIAPVTLGAGMAFGMSSGSPGKSILAVLVALFLQIGVNFANDYSDGMRGTDKVRVGPQRLVASGAATPGQVLGAALLCFALAAIFGLALVIWARAWFFLAFGAAAIVAAWFYTGGKRPYGYLGLGEVFVFLFFGWLATLGTLWVQSFRLPWQAWVLASGVGFLSCALLMVNNLRDIHTDLEAGKRTLAVRLGESRARHAFVALICLGATCGAATLVPLPSTENFHSEVVLGRPTNTPALNALGIKEFQGLGLWESSPVATSLISVLILVTTFGLARWISAPVRRGAKGRALILVLCNTGLLTLFYGLAYGLFLSLA